MTTLWLDTETYNVVDIDVGTYRYAETVEVTLLAWAIDDEEPQVWDVTTGEPMPARLAATLADSSVEVVAHNAMFDRTVLRLGNLKIDVPAERWHCTMSQALAHALPPSLAELGKVLGLPTDQAKLGDGKKLVMKFCKPAPSNHKIRRYTRETSPAEWARFIEYAAQDITAMRECRRRMPTANYRDDALAAYHLDQRINDRGFCVDQELTGAGARAAEKEKSRINARFRELTGGVVDRPSLREQFRAYLLGAYGIDVPNTQGGTFAQLLKDPGVSPVAKELMQLSIAGNKSSTAKYATLHPAVSTDGRFRGGFQFAGAGRTRRWAGRVFQPHNLPSRGLPKQRQVVEYISALKADCHDLLCDPDQLMLLGSAALRGVVVAPPGKRLAVADLSNIEGRMLAWIVGEMWKLQAFRDYDAGIGPDLYNITATSIIGGDTWKVPKANRNVFGKVPDLACFAGGTLVITSNGVKKIKDVTKEDLLWDGIEWVTHQGLVDKGVRQVVRVAGIEVTPDHLIKTQETWLPAKALATCGNTLNRALETGSANLPWSNLSAAAAAEFVRSCASVLVGGRPLLWKPICAVVRQRVATRVRWLRRPIPESVFGVTPTSSPMRLTDAGCSTESQRASSGVLTQTTPPGSITGGAASASLNHSLIGESSLNTSSRFLDGMIRFLSWTGLQTSKPVFDIMNAGPRNRFTVVTEKGFLLAHNCGYEGGVSGFQTFASAYGVKMADYWDTIQANINPEFVQKGRDNLTKGWAKDQIAALEISEQEWLASEVVKLAWRARHPATVAFWRAIQKACVSAIELPGSVHPVGRLKVTVQTVSGHPWLLIALPSGRFLSYFNPALSPDRSITYWGMASDEGSTTRAWVRCYTHGGKLTGNICQTLARDVLVHGMHLAEAEGYPVVLHVHDELVCEVPDTSEFSADRLGQLMATNPPWAPDLPLAAAGFDCLRYKKED